MEWAFFR